MNNKHPHTTITKIMTATFRLYKRKLYLTYTYNNPVVIL